MLSPSGSWRVTVADAVGLIAVGDLQLLVQPKIPLEHLFYLFRSAKALPRVEESYAAAASGDHLWELLATWFVSSLEVVIRRDLIKDYLSFRDELAAARGAIDLVDTANAYYGGRLALACDFDEFGVDTPLNRVLRAAALEVVRSPDLPLDLRRRALIASTRMREVGELRPSDLRISLDRRTSHYSGALAFARSILMSIRRTISFGSQTVFTFLIRTPDLVEAGVRNALKERLEPTWAVFKEPVPLTGAPLNVEPDLIFAYGAAIGDVKYKRTSANWNRADLYEVVAFAEAAGAKQAAVIAFASSAQSSPPSVGVGSIDVHQFRWLVDVRPDNAADALATAVANWLMEPAGETAIGVADGYAGGRHFV